MGRVTFLDGRVGSVVLVGPRSNPKGAMAVLPGDSAGAVKTLPLPQVMDSLQPATLVEVLAVQERAFGNSGLQPLG
ncbi:MAG: hypothetical protein NTZ09_03090 [Candidatus Hydrogenedentes bacterium]|nr:hypothetical protein [Candidatus Hydrogenedentota bacterium]